LPRFDVKPNPSESLNNNWRWLIAKTIHNIPSVMALPVMSSPLITGAYNDNRYALQGRHYARRVWNFGAHT
jgi:hypothetical protein